VSLLVACLVAIVACEGVLLAYAVWKLFRRPKGGVA